MCQYRLINFNKDSTLVGDVDSRGGQVMCEGREYAEKSVSPQFFWEPKNCSKKKKCFQNSLTLLPQHTFLLIAIIIFYNQLIHLCVSGVYRLCFHLCTCTIQAKIVALTYHCISSAQKGTWPKAAEQGPCRLCTTQLRRLITDCDLMKSLGNLQNDRPGSEKNTFL